MRLKFVVFRNRPKFVELVERVKEAVGWNESDIVIELQGRYDVGHGYSHKLMLELEGDIEWEAYVDMVKESQWKTLEVVAARKVVQTHAKVGLDLNWSLCLEAIDAMCWADE